VFSTAAKHQRARNKWPTALERPSGGATPVAPGLGHEIAQSSFGHASTSTVQYTEELPGGWAAPQFPMPTDKAIRFAHRGVGDLWRQPST
jgi:hypothetical protein